MNAFTVVFLAALLAGLGLEIWLARRHLAHVARHRDQLPPAFAGRITLATHRKAADYTRAKTALGMVESVLGAAILLAWTLGGGLEALAGLWRGSELAPLAQGVALMLSVFLVTGLLELPLSAYQTFVIEARFGFNRTTAGTFVADALKYALVGLVIGAPLAAGALLLIEGAGALWWLWVWALWMAVSVLLVWAYPVLIAPLFNRFRPLEDRSLAARIEALLERNGFSSGGVYVMDGSRRSGHGNAYFTGFGRHKRIVFFDTLLEGLAADEVEAVLAHEVGHFRRRHVIKQVALRAALALAGLAVLGWLIEAPWFYQGLGVEAPSPAVALVLFLLVAPTFSFFLQPLLAWVSRRHEFEADEFAAAQTAREALANALVKLYRDNAATLTPDPLYSAFHDSHPPAPVRLAHLEASP